MKVRAADQRRINRIAYRRSAGIRRNNRSPVFFKARIPRLLHVRLAQQKFAVRSIQHVKESVAIGLQQQLARPALPYAVYQNHVLIRVPIVVVVGRELIMPAPLAGGGFERDDGARIKVVEVAESSIGVDTAEDFERVKMYLGV